MKKALLILTTGVVSFAAWSGIIIGNGGDVIVCPGQDPEVRLLDFVEAETLRAGRVQLAEPKGAKYQDKLNNLLERVIRRFPSLGYALSREIVNFELRHAKVPFDLEDIPDSFHKFR